MCLSYHWFHFCDYSAISLKLVLALWFLSIMFHMVGASCHHPSIQPIIILSLLHLTRHGASTNLLLVYVSKRYPLVFISNADVNILIYLLLHVWFYGFGIILKCFCRLRTLQNLQQAKCLQASILMAWSLEWLLLVVLLTFGMSEMRCKMSFHFDLNGTASKFFPTCLVQVHSHPHFSHSPVYVSSM